MLHEVLVALSGHPSPLFTATSSDQAQAGFPTLTPSEQALLQSIGRLADVHRKLRTHISSIATQNRSTVCRAVATAIQQTHLARFQDKVVDVESRILTNDASIVGAYNIVPLAAVVVEFDEWQRLMFWYWDLACFIQQPQPSRPELGAVQSCSGASLINRLRAEQRTGLPEIAQAANELSQVADAAWLRQLSPWILNGVLPSHGAEDFFISGGNVKNIDTEQFSKVKVLAPEFVASSTASSILFIGTSMTRVRKYASLSAETAANGPSASVRSKLVSKHLSMLSNITLPITSSELTRTISSIRQSLSQELLQYVLPMEMTLDLLSCLKQFFLLSRGDFAYVLVKKAEARLHTRQQHTGKLLQADTVGAIKALVIDDSEMQSTLMEALEALSLQSNGDEDHALEYAMRNLSLGAPQSIDIRPLSSDSTSDAAAGISPTVFGDLLFPKPAALSVALPQPLDLFLSQRELYTYSAINSYLLAIERAYLRLSEMWKHSEARRVHPFSNTTSPGARQRLASRRTATRKVWATCSAANFLLAETARYLEGDVVKESCEHFEQWVRQPVDDRISSGDFLDLSTQQSFKPQTQRDPETLASGHRAFLSALTYALLLTDIQYTRNMRSLLGSVDSLIAFFTHLLDVQQKLDLQAESGGETGHMLAEERRVALELDGARTKVDSDLKSVVDRLRYLDHERIGSEGYFDLIRDGGSGFVPWMGGGVDRLLMKLEFGAMTA